LRGQGPPPPADRTIRADCDLEPIDPADPAQVRRLHAFIQFTATHQQVDAALEIAAGIPGLIEKASAGAWLSQRLGDGPQPGAHTVVCQCRAWHLLDHAEQDWIQKLLNGAGRRYPLSYITFGPPAVGTP
jgi:hypothetical protein